MTVLSFIKENRVLVAGLTLPLLLIGILAFAKSLPSSLTPSPIYKVMYYSASWSDKGQISVKVNEDGKLEAVMTPSSNPQTVPNSVDPKVVIYLYDPITDTVEDTTVTLDKSGQVTSLDKFEDVKLSSQTIAPDGYIFEPYYYRNHSLITDIFTYRSGSNGPVLTKKGKLVKIPQPTTYYGQLNFLGWEITK